jgi:hypothetical protein
MGKWVISKGKCTRSKVQSLTYMELRNSFKALKALKGLGGNTEPGKRKAKEPLPGIGLRTNGREMNASSLYRTNARCINGTN